MAELTEYTDRQFSDIVPIPYPLDFYLDEDGDRRAYFGHVYNYEIFGRGPRACTWGVGSGNNMKHKMLAHPGRYIPIVDGVACEFHNESSCLYRSHKLEFDPNNIYTGTFTLTHEPINESGNWHLIETEFGTNLMDIAPGEYTLGELFGADTVYVYQNPVSKSPRRPSLDFKINGNKPDWRFGESLLIPIPPIYGYQFKVIKGDIDISKSCDRQFFYSGSLEDVLVVSERPSSITIKWSKNIELGLTKLSTQKGGFINNCKQQWYYLWGSNVILERGWADPAHGNFSVVTRSEQTVYFNDIPINEIAVAPTWQEEAMMSAQKSGGSLIVDSANRSVQVGNPLRFQWLGPVFISSSVDNKQVVADPLPGVTGDVRQLTSEVQGDVTYNLTYRR